jgi:hypothetical protein
VICCVLASLLDPFLFSFDNKAMQVINFIST